VPSSAAEINADEPVYTPEQAAIAVGSEHSINRSLRERQPTASVAIWQCRGQRQNWRRHTCVAGVGVLLADDDVKG
jgi:hypothetical protein